MRKAVCCCGDCSIAVEGEPVLNAICNCSSCKKRTGSAFGWSAYFPDDKVLAKTGELKTYSKRGDAGYDFGHVSFRHEDGYFYGRAVAVEGRDAERVERAGGVASAPQCGDVERTGASGRRDGDALERRHGGRDGAGIGNDSGWQQIGNLHDHHLGGDGIDSSYHHGDRGKRDQDGPTDRNACRGWRLGCVLGEPGLRAETSCQTL